MKKENLSSNNIPSISWLKDEMKLTRLPDSDIWALSATPPGSWVYKHIGDVKHIVIHHSATDTGSVTHFRCFHRAVFSWLDVGYHYVIGNGSYSGDGEVEKGRPEWAIGAHARNQNKYSLGICLVGNFQKDNPTPAQLESLGKLLRELLEKYELDPEAISRHCDLPGMDTECPGENLPIDKIRKLLKE